MKKYILSLYGITNIILSGIALYLWNTNSDTYSGGICEYWRCISSDIIFVQGILFTLVIANILFIISIFEIEHKVGVKGK